MRFSSWAERELRPYPDKLRPRRGTAVIFWPWDLELATLDHDKWYCLEGQIKLNTPGVGDGELRGWVDEQAAFDKTDIAFRRSNEGWMNIKSFWFDIYYGGDDSAVRNEINFDSLALSGERIGCDGSYDGTFYDDDGSPFENDIDRFATAGVTKGCNPPANTKFCPELRVDRKSMAAFLHRAFGDN